MFDDLTDEGAQALRVVQVEFARDIALRTAQAYQQTLDIIMRDSRSPEAT